MQIFRFLVFLYFFLFCFSLHAKDIKTVNNSKEFLIALDLSLDGDSIILKSGVYIGNFVVDKSVNLIGDGYVLLTSNNFNRVLNIVSKDVKIIGVLFYNSGKNMSLKDACLFVNGFSDSFFSVNNFFIECGFGIWIDGSSYNYISDNIFLGTSNNILSDRGNSVQLYRNNGTVVTNNFIINGRDGIYISNSKEVSIYNNIFVNNRFAIHYMFSHKCNVVSNSSIDSLVGAAIMYSKYVDLFNNIYYFNLGHGLFLRDVLFSRIFKNKSLYNTDGLFLGSSYYNDLINNDIIKNVVGVKVSNGSNENLVFDNNFIINRLQVQFLDNKTVIWNFVGSGNFWSHYLGWDLNKDNIGDKKFYVTNISDRLIFSYPVLRIMFNSPALVLLQKIENQFPAFRGVSIIDNYPLMGPVLW